jgi:putative integral membrane protein (TIGR02587 family)
MAGDTRARQGTGVLGQAVLATCGAVLLASNVAPTEEIVLIAIESTRWKILILALLSLGLGGLVLFFSDLPGTEEPAGSGKAAGAGGAGGVGAVEIVSRTALHYAVALVASALILWFFGRFDGASLATGLAETVVLGVPASLGASAGRLLLQ